MYHPFFTVIFVKQFYCICIELHVEMFPSGQYFIQMVLTAIVG